MIRGEMRVYYQAAHFISIYDTEHIVDGEGTLPQSSAIL